MLTTDHERVKRLCQEGGVRGVASKWVWPVLVAHHMSASVVAVGPVGKWSGAERLSTCPQGAGGLRRSVSRGLPGWSFDGLAVGGVAGETSGPVEEGECSIRILMDPDRGLDVVVSGRGGGGDLEDAPFVAHGVVAGDRAVCAATEDVVDLAGVLEGHEGTVFEFGLGREASVVVGQVGVCDEAVCGFDRRDPRQRQFLDEAVLEGAEGALGASARLGRIGSDVLDAELVEGAADLGALILGDLAACLGGVEVVAAAVGIERLPGSPLSQNTCFSARKVDAVPSSSTRKAE